MNVSNLGLVLEGGGMRGVFTCGVLDYFLDQQLEFPYTVGVSAGACNGLSYISKQRGRGKKTNVDLLEEYKYIGLKHFIKKRNLLDFDFLFHDIPERLLPYDYDTYFASQQRFEIVTANCLTGQPNYWEDKDSQERLISLAKASSSLPLMCPISYVDNIPMLDGGICDSIPVLRAMDQGYKKNVVVLTRNHGYRKTGRDIKVPSFVYRKYPAMREALSNRNKLYNDQLQLIENLEDEGKVLVIRPQLPIEVDRLEKDTQKLTDLYNQGYNCAKQVLESQLAEAFYSIR